MLIPVAENWEEVEAPETWHRPTSCRPLAINVRMFVNAEAYGSCINEGSYRITYTVGL